MFADRTSTATLFANQVRLYFAAFASALVEAFRRLGLAGTGDDRAQVGTLRAKFLKVAVCISVRRVLLSFSSTYAWKEPFARVLANLRAAAVAPT